jgi:chemotaxis protein MotB
LALHQSGKEAGARQPGLVVVHDGDKPSVGTYVQFAEHSAELDEPSRRRLDDVVPLMMGKPYKVEIRGHSSRRPPAADGTTQDVWQLSFARCAAVLAYLESQGILPERFRLSQAGPYEPGSPREEENWRLHGSRVEVFMLDEIVESLAPSHQKTPQPGPPAGEAAGSNDPHGHAEPAASADLSDPQGHPEPAPPASAEAPVEDDSPAAAEHGH